MNTRDAVRLYLAAQPSRYKGKDQDHPAEADLLEAAKIAGNWRRNGPAATAAILYALHMDHHYSHGDLHDVTEIPTTTIGRMIEQHRQEVATGG